MKLGGGFVQAANTQSRRQREDAAAVAEPQHSAVGEGRHTENTQRRKSLSLVRVTTKMTHSQLNCVIELKAFVETLGFSR